MDWWNWLSRFDTVVSIIGATAASYAAVKLWRQNKKLVEIAANAPRIEGFQKLLEAYEGVATSAPVAIAISLLKNNQSIKPSVDKFLVSQNLKMPIEELNMNGINGREDLELFVNELAKLKRLCDAKGYTEVHLFVAAPVQAGVLIGAMFDHWRTVKLYHRPTPEPPQVYEYWMPLTK